MLLNIKASQIDLLFVVPDVCLPALGAPAQGGRGCIRLIYKTAKASLIIMMVLYILQSLC